MVARIYEARARIESPASLRDYVWSDRAEVMGLLRPVLRELYPGGQAWLARRLDDIAAGRASCILATREAKVVGVAITTPKSTGRVKISTLYVIPTARGNGIGGQLLKEVLNRLRLRGVHDVYITAAHSVENQIRPLLQAYSFTKLYRVPNRYGLGRHEDIYGTWLS